MDPNNPNQPQQTPPGGYPPPQQPPPPAYPPSGAYPPPQQPAPSGAYSPPGAYPPQMPPSGAYPPPQYPPSNGYPPPYTGQPFPGQQQYPGQNQAKPSQLPAAFASFTTGDWLVGGGAVLLLIVSFLPWYGFNDTRFNYSFNAWSAWPGTIAAFLGIELLAIMGLRMAHMKLVLPVSDKIFNMGTGVAIAVLSLIYLTIAGNFSGINLSAAGFGPSFGLFIGVLCGLAIAAGGYLQPNTPATY